MTEFFRNYIVEIAIFVLVLGLAISSLFDKKSLVVKLKNHLNTQLKKYEYKEYVDLCKSVLINSPLSFNITEQTKNNELDNMYDMTIAKGGQLLVEEKFFIPNLEV